VTAVVHAAGGGLVVAVRIHIERAVFFDDPAANGDRAHLVWQSKTVNCETSPVGDVARHRRTVRTLTPCEFFAFVGGTWKPQRARVRG